MAKDPRTPAAPVVRTTQTLQPPCGSVRPCTLYAGELARHRVITGDGFDYVVATVREGRQAACVTGAYPVVRGYLVMMRQPLYEVRQDSAELALEEHERLVSVLAEAGVRVVRARKLLAARQRAEAREAAERVAAAAALGKVTPISLGRAALGRPEDHEAAAALS
jgi:hypothetical protein